MPAAISCVTVPVDDLRKSVGFYSALGLTPEESDEDSAAFDLDGVYLVLLQRSEFGVYVESVGHGAAAKGSSETILSYFTDSRGDVDSLLAKAKAAGAGRFFPSGKRAGSNSCYCVVSGAHQQEVLCDAG